MSYSSTETAIAACEAIKTGYQQKKGGTFVTFLISENPDDSHEGLTTLPLGEVVQLYVTKKDQGA
jgi:hypothetical protein